MEEAIFDAAVWKARLYLMSGDLAAASSEHERATATTEVRPYSRTLEQLTLARLLIARSEPGEALRLLERLHETTKTVGKRIEILALQALALWERGERERAVSTLTQALAVAEPEGYVRTFADEGSPMAEILSATLEAQRRNRLEPPVPAHYLRKLRAALERDRSDTASPEAVLPEPPSERELEVLTLVTAGKSNRQIASELFVSVGTVKTHINNLYRKLGAHSRTQAVARAKELNLL